MPQYNLISNIVGGWSKSDIRISNLAESINIYCETQGEGASSSQILRSIQGTSDLIDLETDEICRGLFVPSRTFTGNIDTIIGVFGDTVYCIRMIEGVYQKTIIGKINNSVEPVGICETGGEGSANPHICIVDGSSLYAFDSTLEEGEMINDFRSIQLPYRVVQPDPNNPSIRIFPTHICYCKNYILVNDSRNRCFLYKL